MENTIKKTFLTNNSKYFLNSDLLIIQHKIDKLSKEDEDLLLSNFSFKTPLIALLLSIFLGGLAIDRFYIGDIKLAIAKLLLSWMTFGIWWLVDLFLIMKAAKKVNLYKFYSTINI